METSSEKQIYIEILGFTGGLLCSLANLPQLIHIMKHKQTDGISTTTYIVISTGLLLSVVYGILLNLMAIYVWNTVGLLLSISVLVQKAIVERRQESTQSIKSPHATAKEPLRTVPLSTDIIHAHTHTHV